MPEVLSKKEKKLARELIDKGVDIEFRNTMEAAAAIVKEWEQGKFDNSAAYKKLYGKITQRDKFIARRYDGVTGSHYLTTVAGMYIDGQITEEEIEGFSEENKAILNKWKSLSQL